MSPSAAITQRALVRFWSPLWATWLMMAVEGPFLAAVIARLPDPKPNLAAYGVAFALAIVVEAPVIMMLSAATALVTDRPRFLALRRFARVLNVVVTATMIVVLVTPAGRWLLEQILGLDAQVSALTRGALLLLLPWPAAIGYRRFYQGVLIRDGRTRRVALGTVVRVAAMASAAVVLRRHTGWPGAWVGGAALSIGVCAEAAAVRWMVRPVLTALCARPPDALPDPYLGQRAILDFYAPLALTSGISLAVNPLVTFFMGQARYSLESLAVLPVVNSLVFVFRTFGLSVQEVAIAKLAQDPANLGPVRRFAGWLALISSAGLAVIAFTPLATAWYEGLSGLSPELARFATGPTRLFVPVPALSVVLALEWALLVGAKRTRPITAASVVEIGVIGGALAVGIHGLHLVGVVVAAAAFLMGRLTSTLVLVGPALASARAQHAQGSRTIPPGRESASHPAR